MDPMTVSGVKVVNGSRELSPNSAVPLTSAECFGIFQLIVLVLRPAV